MAQELHYSLCGSGDIYEILVVYLQHIIPNYILLSTIPISEFFSALDILSQINQGWLLIMKIHTLAQHPKSQFSLF